MKKIVVLLPVFFLLIKNLSAQSVLGIDVSHHQGTINWAQVAAAGKVFAWVKATEGVTYTDPNYTTNMTNGTTAGVVMGAYHFARPLSNSAVNEANHFLAVAGSLIVAGYLPPALDLEDPPGGSLTGSMSSAALTTWAETWMSTVQNATGIAPVIYTSSSIAAYVGSSLNTYKLWIAKPDGNATTPPTGLGVWNPNWLVKQYSWTGTVPGISASGVDLDVFNGTINDFNTLIGGSVTPPVCNNDNICNAATLSINTSCNNIACSTINATPPTPAIPYMGASSCTSTYQAGRYDDDVWFSITPGNTDPVTITVTPTSNMANFDPAVGIYTGNCNSPTQTTCADLYSEGQTETITYTPVAGTTYFIRVFSYGIGSSFSGNFNICVSAGCTPPTTPLVTGDASFCSNANGNIAVSNPCNGCNYLWSNGQSGTGISVTTSGNYSVTASNSCSTAVSNSFQVTEVTAVSPSVTIAAGSASVCAGDTVWFIANAVYGGNAPAYQWFVNNNLVANGSSYSTATLADGDSVYCKMTSSEQCVSSTEVFSTVLQMQVNKVDTPVITLSGCELQTNLFQQLSYQWYYNMAAVANATGHVFTANQTGNYYVIVEDSNLCTARSAAMYVSYPACMATGIVPVNDVFDFTVYALDNSTWQVTVADRLLGGQAEVYNVLGEMVQKLPVAKSLTLIDSRFLLPGMYLIKITKEKTSASSKKIMKY